MRTSIRSIEIQRLFCGDVNGRRRCFAFFFGRNLPGESNAEGGEARYEIGIKTSPPVAANFAAHKLVDLP